MANISIGGVTPKINPSRMTLIRPDKATASVPTYTGVAYFEWPPTIVGKEITFLWDFMDADDFAAIDAVFATTGTKVFNPNDGLGKTFNVNIMSLDGDYCLGLDNSANSVRKDVAMKILIMSQV